MAPYCSLDTDVAFKQRQPLETLSLTPDALKEQHTASHGGSSSQILNPTRWLTALSEYCKDNRAAMALLTNIQQGRDQHEWKFVRFLGSGSFGAAALYRQEDGQQQVLDVLAIKAALRTQSDLGEPDNGGWPLITMEAAVMTQLNQFADLKGIDSFLYLRKYSTGPQMPSPWPNFHDAYYLEYCPYGDLQQLKLHHQAWQKHVSEAFIWHLFHSFAKACETMEHGSFRWLGHDGTEIYDRIYNYGDEIPGTFVLHGDIKPANIFLTSPAADKVKLPRYPEFPSVRLGDYGCARVLHREDDNSRRWQLRRGNREYQPPELRTNHFDSLWEQKWYRGAGKQVSKLFGRKHITPSANIWAFAAVIWELMTLRDIAELNKAVNSRVRPLPFGTGTRGSAVDSQLMSPLGRNAPRYSDELKDLVVSCLNLDPKERPPSRYLSRVTLENTWEKYDILCRDLREGKGRQSDMELMHIKGVYHYPPCTLGEAQFDLDDLFWRRYAANVTLWRDEELPLDIPPGGEGGLTVVMETVPELRDAWRERVAGENAPADERNLMWEAPEYNDWFRRRFKRDLDLAYHRSARARRAQMERERENAQLDGTTQQGGKRKIGAFAPQTAPTTSSKRSRKASLRPPYPESNTEPRNAAAGLPSSSRDGLHVRHNHNAIESHPSRDQHDTGIYPRRPTGRSALGERAQPPYRSATRIHRKPILSAEPQSAARSGAANVHAQPSQPPYRSASQTYQPPAAATAVPQSAARSPRSPRSPGQGARQRQRARLIPRKELPRSGRPSGRYAGVGGR